MRKMILATLALLGMGCRGGSTEAMAARSATSIPVEVGHVLEEDVIRRVDVTGTLAPYEEATVSFEIDGRIVKLLVDLGDRVRKGDVLASVAVEEWAWKRSQAEAELAAAEADLKRLETLGKRDITTKQQLDEARRRVEVARSAAALARKKLFDTELRAPISGLVARRMVNLGEYVRSGTPAFYLVKLSPLKLKVEVPERYVTDIAIGASVEVRTQAYDKELAGKVIRIGPAISTESRSFPVEIEVENPGDVVKSGAFARASIVSTQSKRGLTIPESAVVYFAGNPRVFVVEGDKVKERPVTLAGRVKDRFVVADGVRPGEVVVVYGANLLSDGAPITVRRGDAR